MRQESKTSVYWLPSKAVKNQEHLFLLALHSLMKCCIRFASCAWNSWDAAGSNAIDFSTHFKTPFFDSAVVGLNFMHIALSFNEFAISSFAVISSWLCEHVYILILMFMAKHFKNVDLGFLPRLWEHINHQCLFQIALQHHY